MHNLYKRLGLSKTATELQIKQKLLTIKNQQFQKDVQTILLIKNNRIKYDELYDLLIQIGQLRSKLGMNYSDNWKGEVIDDFTPDKIIVDLKYDKFQNKIHSKISDKEKNKFRDKKTTPIPSFLKLVLIIILLLIAYTVIKNLSSDTEYQNSTTTEQRNQDRNSRSNDLKENDNEKNLIEKVNELEPIPYIEIPYPKHGDLKINFKGERIAPFEIKSEIGGYYLLKLQKVSKPNEFLSIFVHGGKKIDINIPLGRYILKYAFGYKWYGYEILFGNETSYSKASEIFEFKVDDDQVSGYTITLYAIIGGNLKTTEIEPEEF